MILTAISRSLYGIAIASLFSFFFYTTYYIGGGEVLNAQLVLINQLGNFALGITFGLTSLFFEIDRWSLTKQTAAHFVCTITVFNAVGLSLGWFTAGTFPIVLNVLIFIAIYTSFWFGFYTFNRKMAESMNNLLN
ncbi:hypothetical protein CR205_02590 [Alteribacter lacisalsi]|uniref:DUF3021 domain-containing protein n=1 Tax=Alteribacter lacisalsi TaxID=2045244 RepID=A0A2W0HK96_9BACI|nr:DUF3021 domain-containing protein [Alteribacter lacisalsi]PYZ97502.1 hypothetical protein CR205_02590 [Alteribacter lacisalsi]